MNAFQLDVLMTMATKNPPCNCGHRLQPDHDLDDKWGHCTTCGCVGYEARPCLQLDSSHLPCAKPVGHDGAHYFPKP